jgi:hypothetical protein
MEVMCTSETSVVFQRNKRRDMPEDGTSYVAAGLLLVLEFAYILGVKIKAGSSSETSINF